MGYIFKKFFTVKKLIFFFLLLFECLNFKSINKEIELYFKKGEFEKSLQIIQKEERQYNLFEKPPELTLWKARIFSLYPETFEMSIKLYQEYISKKQSPEIYYELFLLYLDMNYIDELKNIVSGESLPEDLIFEPKIVIIRNFLECYLKAKELKNQQEILNFPYSIKDEYLENYCKLTQLDTFLKKKLKDTANLKVTLINKEIFNIQLNSFKNYLKNQNEYLQLETILNYFYKHFNLLSQTLDPKEKLFCELKERFPDVELSTLSIENCKEMFKESLIIQRKIIHFTINKKKPIPPLFDESIYQLNTKL